MREVDRLTTERYGIPSILLMENAAHAVARVISEKLGGSVKGKSILILCGKGNNGGDGAALARILSDFGGVVEVTLFGRVAETNGDARTNFNRLLTTASTDFNKKGDLYFEETPLMDYWVHAVGTGIRKFDIFVDALFGTGLTKPLDSPFSYLPGVIRDQWSETATVSGEPAIVVSVDIPSGLDSDSSDIPDIHITADVTVTFTSPKAANVLSPAYRSNGELVIAEIGSPFDLILEQESGLFLGEKNDARRWLEQTTFSPGDYKNKRGHALIVAGSEDYSGAAVMCGNSAMRSGVGLTTLLVSASCKVEVASRVIPEVIVRTLSETDGDVDSDAFAANADVFRQADSILVGPGLKATDKGVERLVREIVENRKVPVVVDAGALAFLNSPPYKGGVAPASGDGVVLFRGEATSVVSDKFPVAHLENHPVGETPPPLVRKVRSCVPLILTPHEGEFMRLVGTEDRSVIEDRVAAVREFAVANNVILVLKGERVLIGAPDGRVVVNPTGNSGLGKAGNGDTLAGILAGFVAQAVKFEIDIFETVVAAVYVAGMAGDVAERKFGKRVMTASDVRDCLVEVFAELE